MHISSHVKVSLITIVALLFPVLASAHQPRIVESRQTNVPAPEVSKAYYGELVGVPDVFTIESATPFNLYVGVLVPDIVGQQKDISAIITKDGIPVATLDGTTFTWTQFFEDFGHDTYWQGPEYKARVDAGTYEIRVWNNDEKGKYSLAIGETEAFDFKEGMNALTLIPELKRNFFGISPINFMLSPMAWMYIAVMYILAGIAGFAYRAILKKLASNSPRGLSKNIGTPDRALRFLFGIALLLWAVLTTWSPVIIFFSGFCFFEAIFSWCGFYAALGRNTCPLE